MAGPPHGDAEPPIAPAEAVTRGGRGQSQLRRTPALTIDAIKLVRRAAPGPFAVTTVLQILVAVLTGVQLFVIKSLIAELVQIDTAGGGEAWELAPLFGALLAANVTAGISAAGIVHQQQLMSELVGHRTMEGIIGVASRVGLASYESPDFHDHLERARAAALYRPIEMVNSVTMLLTAVLTSAALGVALITLEPVLVPLVLLAGLPVLLAAVVNSHRTYAFEYSMTVHAREHLHFMEVLTGHEFAKELRTSSAIAVLRARYDALTRERVQRLRVFLRQRLAVSLVATIATALGLVIALGSLVWLLTSGRTDIATGAAAALAMYLLASRLQTIFTSVGKVVEGGMFLDDYHRFLAFEDASEQRLPPGLAGAGSFQGAAVERLSFSYPGTARRVLEDVSLHVGPGEVVAIVGENGSGKTTLVKLLCQLYREPEAGRVVWSGSEARALDPHIVRDQITVLFQDFARYDLTVADNIALGRAAKPRDDARVVDAARSAGVHEMIEALPNGYETRLGRRFYGGAELSGGQWQRLALARAFYRGGELLILDEPTAALDPRAEYELFEHVRALAAQKSVLLISHRFSNVRMADRIYVLRDGRIVERGTHDELLGAEGLYAELYNLQAAAYFGEAPVAPARDADAIS